MDGGFNLISELPEFFKLSFAGIQLWQAIGIILFFVFGYLFYKLLNIILCFVETKIINRLKFPEVLEKYPKILAKPFSLLLIFLAVLANYKFLELPESLNLVVVYSLKFIIPFFITLFLYYICDLVTDILGKLAERTSSTVDDHLVPILRKVLKIIVISLGLIFMLENYGLDITPFIAGLSISGLAIALAAQETLKNLFGSVTILTDQPFRVGDYVKVSNEEGNIEAIGLRSTRIRTFNNSLITMPNGKLADTMIDNYGMRQYKRFLTKLGVDYKTTLTQIDSFTTGIKKIIEEHPHTRKDYYQVALSEFADSSLIILINVFFEVPDYPAELEAKQDLLKSIMMLAKELEISFAYPSQSVYLEQTPVINVKGLPGAVN